ncbi:MAG: DNA polymerase I [Rikenellaceae bacterium]
MKRLFLIDAYALIFRYYYAFLGREMRNRDGFNTSIVFGFAKFLRDLLRRENPDLLGVAFDPAGGSFRRRLYPEYKANRAATPEDILLSTPYVKRLVEAMCIPILEVADYEADDVIGTLAHKGVEAGYRVYMVTPDKDYGQLVCDQCVLYKHKGDGVEIIDRDAIAAKYGIDDPQLVRDILAIWGDASDNIPGVNGIGEKGACKLVQQWGTVENILANVSQIKGKQGERLADGAEQLLLSKELTTICLDVPIEFEPSQLTMCQPDVEALRELYTELNFKAFLAELGDAPAQQIKQLQQPKQPLSAKQTKQAAAMVGQFDLFAPPAEQQAISTMSTAENTPHTYHIVKGVEQLRELVERLMKCEEFCFDTETTGLELYVDRVIGMSFAVKPHEAWYLPVSKENMETYAEVLQPLFAAEHIAKVGQNLKFDIAVLRQMGVEVEGRLIDTMLLHYLLDAESRHNMDALAERYLNYSPIKIESLIGSGARQTTMDRVAVDRVAEYAAEDADVTLRLKHELWAQVEREGLRELYERIEEPMIRVLVDMEMTGVVVDSEALGRYGEELNGRLEELLADIRRDAGDEKLNVNSSIQLGEVLFGRMKIADKPKLTKTKRYCTDEEYLQSFAGQHAIIDKILEYRGVKKLLSTYIEALPQLVNRVSGRIHSTYNQAVTATGRLSSSNPNLQNIPIRDELGRPIRAAFVASGEDRQILSADYSQVELRIMAHLSGDEALIEAFRAGEDIHTATAARLFHKELSEVTSDDRRKAKTANFGIIYGISAFGLSQRLDIGRAEAKEIIEGYFASYPGVKGYMDRVMGEARQSEYVETLFGRRRVLRDINSRNAVARGLAERNAINAPIQGSAADIMKLAMIGIRRELLARGLRSQMIMQVHDEVVIDMLRSEESQVRELVAEQMECAVELSVALPVECGVGDSWLAAH